MRVSERVKELLLEAEYYAEDLEQILKDEGHIPENGKIDDLLRDLWKSEEIYCRYIICKSSGYEYPRAIYTSDPTGSLPPSKSTLDLLSTIEKSDKFIDTPYVGMKICICIAVMLAAFLCVHFMYENSDISKWIASWCIFYTGTKVSFEIIQLLDKYTGTPS
jgi:hypothetical protein